MIKLYSLPFLIIASVIWLILKYLSKDKNADNTKIITLGLVSVDEGPKIIFRNYNKAYLFLYRNVWTVLIFLLIMGNNFNELIINKNIITASLIILVININNLIDNLKKYTYDMKANPYPISLKEVSEMGEIDGTEVFKTLAQKKVGEKEYRILKNAFST